MPLAGRAPDAFEAEYLDLTAQCPCVVCLNWYELDSPAEIHHLQGKTKPNAHLFAIALCANHHRIPDNHHPKRWVSRHGDGRRKFEARYAPEHELLEMHSKNVFKLRVNQVLGLSQ